MVLKIFSTRIFYFNSNNIQGIIEILNNNTLRSKSNIEDEYNKLYSKYRLKYEDYKLKQFLRGKLYQKGYSVEEINSIID